QVAGRRIEHDELGVLVGDGEVGDRRRGEPHVEARQLAAPVVVARASGEGQRAPERRRRDRRALVEEERAQLDLADPYVEEARRHARVISTSSGPSKMIRWHCSTNGSRFTSIRPISETASGRMNGASHCACPYAIAILNSFAL